MYFWSLGLIINNHDQSFKMKPNKTWPFPMAIFSHRVTYRKWYLVVGTSGRHKQSNNNIKIQSMASAFKVHFCVIWDKNINTIHYSFIKWWWLVNLFMQNIYFNLRLVSHHHFHHHHLDSKRMLQSRLHATSKSLITKYLTVIHVFDLLQWFL